MKDFGDDDAFGGVAETACNGSHVHVARYGWSSRLSVQPRGSPGT